MTRDDIIRMARATGLDFVCAVHGLTGAIEDFARVVAAAKEQQMIADGWRQCAKGQRTTQFCAMTEQAVAAEREACAQVCDDVRAEADELVRPNLSQEAFYGYAVATLDCAKAIRARGEL